MSSWKTKSFNEAPIEIIDGDRGVNYPQKTEFQSEGYCLFLNTSNVTINGFNFNSMDFISKEKDETLRKGKLKRGDLILTTRGTVGNVAFYNNEIPYDNIRINSGMIILRVNKKEIHPYYLYLFLRSSLFKSQVISQGSGSAQPQLPIGSLKYILITWKDLFIQKQIVSVLLSLDSKIELNNRINAELEVMAKTLYDYWFVQFDFPNAEGKPYKSSGGKMVWNEVLKRELPEGWKSGELQDIANIKMGQSPPGESYNNEGDGMIFYQGCTDFGNRFPTIRQYTTKPTRFAKEGDILLSVRAPVGTLNIAKKDCCIGRGLSALNSKDKCIAYLFGIMVNLKQIFDRRNVDGTTFGSITKDDLFSLKVIRPDNDILKQYHNIISPAFEKQNLIELENQQLSSLRDWLLPMLMNGQVKVGDVEEEDGLIAAEPMEKYGCKK